MPTYEYRCLKCSKRFEVFQSIKEPPLKKCQYCLGKVERVIGLGGGVIFKGSGFYTTDYRNSDYKEKAKKDKPSPCSAKKDGCKGCPKADN